MQSSGTWDAFTDFLNGVAAASELHGRAGDAGCFVENVCLGASLVDALLRVGLILQHQLDKRTTDIPLNLVLQGDSDQPISEREIYRRAQSQKIINNGTFNDLQRLYDDRNRVIHRFIISRITTSDVLDIAIRYQRMVKTLGERVHAIESRQIEEGVGITVPGPAFEGVEAKEWLQEMVEKKHTTVLAKLLRGS